MTAPPRTIIGGPDAPPDPTAVMGRRILAWFLDLAIFLGVMIAVYAAQAEYIDIPDRISSDDACAQLEAVAPGGEVGSCSVFNDRVLVLSDAEVGVQTLSTLGYFAAFVLVQGVVGGSPGKLLTGLRVVDRAGNRAGVGKSLGRTLAWVVDAAPWMVPLVAIITGLTSDGHRRVGDMLAGTFVVGARDVGSPVGTAPVALPDGATWGAPPVTAPTAPPRAAPMPPAYERSRPDPIEIPEPEVIERDIVDTPVDEAPPTVDANPDWYRTPDLDLPDVPAGGFGSDDGPADFGEPPMMHAPEAPAWEPPTSPTEDSSWRPPTSPFDEPPPAEPEPSDVGFAPPGSTDLDGTTPAPAPDETPPVVTPPREPASDPAYPPPQWDDARGTYLQWDPTRQAWLEWDDARQRWKPIDT